MRGPAAGACVVLAFVLAALQPLAAAQQADGALWITMDTPLVWVEPGRNQTLILGVAGQHRCPLSPPPSPRIVANPVMAGPNGTRIWFMEPRVVEPVPVRVEGETPPLYRINATFEITIRGEVTPTTSSHRNVTWNGNYTGQSTSTPCSPSGFSWTTAHAGRTMVKWNGTPAGSDDWEPRPFTSPTADVAPPRFEGASEVPGDARAVVAVLVALAAIGLLVSWTRRR